MQVRLLGPVDVLADGASRAVPGLRSKAVLATLALHAGDVVSVDRLVEVVWGDAPPPTAGNTLQSHVSRLRRFLGLVIHARSPGYRLDPATEPSDAMVAEGLIRRGLASARPGERAEHLGAALALWRGPSLADVEDRPWLSEHARRLDQLRAQAERALLETRLALGEHAEMLPELERKSRESPFDEQLHALLITALYRTGRQADALATYQRLVRSLDRELGIQPGRALRDLEVAVVRQDPALTAPDAGWVDATVPMQLPPALAPFAGREAELAELDALLPAAGRGPETVVITAVSGTAGIGKTTLAVHWGHRVADRFPDGQLYVNLRGFGPAGEAVEPADALAGFLEALGMPATRIPSALAARAALYRSLLSDRQVLVLLDNARDAEQVRPLLPSTAGCLAVVTSRRRLSPLVAAEGAHPLVLELPSVKDAAGLLIARLGTSRVIADPTAVAQIVARCGRLPLALAITAARAASNPRLPLAAVASGLGEADETDLEALDGGDPTVDVRSVFSWSYQALDPDAARLFRLLGLHPGSDFGAGAAASLAGVPLPEARTQLAALTGGHLLTEQRPERYAFHDLLRAYAAEQARQTDGEPERAAAVRRLIDHYTAGAEAAAERLYVHRDEFELPPIDPAATIPHIADRAAALNWLDSHRPELLAAADLAAAAGLDTHVWHLGHSLQVYLDRGGRGSDQVAVQAAGLAAAERLGNTAWQAASEGRLGFAYLRVGRLADGLPHLSASLRLFEQIDDLSGQASTLISLVMLAVDERRLDEALDMALRALELYRRDGRPRFTAIALNAVGWVQVLRGEYGQALDRCREAIALLQGVPDDATAALVWDSIGYAHHHLGNFAEAVACYQRSLALVGADGDRRAEADSLVRLGESQLAAGNAESAQHAWLRALAILDSLEQPAAAEVRARLRRLDPLRAARARRAN